METLPQMTDDAELVATLKEGGVDDPAFHSMWGTWIMIQRRLADASPDEDRARIEIDLKMADIYIAGGHVGLALECLESAREQAWQKHMDELDSEIGERIKRIEKPQS